MPALLKKSFRYIDLSIVKNMAECYRDLMKKIMMAREKNLFAMPVVLLLAPTLMVVMAMVGFYFGKPVTAWYGGFSFGICLAFCIIGAFNKKDCFKRIFTFTGALFLILLLVSLSFFLVYFSDAVTYHNPASILVAEGWNPLFESNLDSLQSSMDLNLAKVRSDMIVYMPKIAWVFGGIMNLMTGSTVSFMASSLVLMLCLGMVIHRFSRMFLGKSVFLRWSLIGFLLGGPTLLYALWILVDYLLYTSILICILSFVMYMHDKQLEDAGMFVLSSIWLINAKMSGLLFGAVIFSLLALSAFVKYILKEYSPEIFQKTLIVIVLAGGMSFFAGSAPYLTNWVNHGSPAYPEHTLNPKESAQSLVTRYVPDEQGAKVGFLGRVAHAWFSKDATLKFYKMKFGDKRFSPQFHKLAAPMHGYGRAFGLLMCLSLVCFFMTRRSMVDVAILVIFLSAIATPSRFIGAARYTPQIWAVPFITLVNFVVNPKDFVVGLGNRFGKFARFSVCSVIYVFMMAACMVSLGWVGFHSICTLAISVEQMKAYQEIKTWPKVEVLMASFRETKGIKVFNEDCLTLCMRPEAFYYEKALSGSGLKNVDFIYQGEVRRTDELNENQCILFADQGFLLTSNSQAEYERWFGDDKPWNIRTLAQLKDADFLSVVKGVPNYLSDLTSLRMDQINQAWFGRNKIKQL